MSISLIAAVSRNGIIGVNGAMAWRCPFDMRIFREWTMGKMLICGRNTFESMGSRVLPGRGMIVLTSQKEVLPHAGIQPRQATSLKAALQLAENSVYADAVVIGGEAAYAEALPLCDDLLITWIDLSVEYTATLEAKKLTSRFPVCEMFRNDIQNIVHNTYEGEDGNLGFAFAHYKKKEADL
jgi:dihydrofolate reductase